MKIVNKEEFYKLSEGVVYSEYEPCIITELFIKGSTLSSKNTPIDYTCLSLIGNLDSNNSEEFYNILESSQENKTTFKLDFENYSRDGLYGDDQLYCIYEKQDLEELIKVLQDSLSRYAR